MSSSEKHALRPRPAGEEVVVGHSEVDRNKVTASEGDRTELFLVCS